MADKEKITRKSQPNIIKRGLLKVFANEKWQPITIPIISILLSLIVASIIILSLGKNPLGVFYNLLQGAGIFSKPNYAGFKSQLTDFLSLLDSMAPMVFASLAVAVAMRAGLFNIGASGQMLFGGFLSTVLVGYSGLPAIIAKPLVIIVGVAAGAILGGLVGFLKYRFNINEVVSTIMFNYIVQYIISFFIHTYYIDPVSRQSRYIDESTRLTLANVETGGLKMDISIGIVLSIIVAIALKLFLDKTRAGFEINSVGANPKAAQYAGINVGKTMVSAMVLSGGLAGLAGVTYFLGYYSSIQPRVLPGTGFDAVAVSLLGNNNPIGIIVASFIVSIIDKGSTYMSSNAGIRHEIASLITGLILLFSACGSFIRYRINKAKSEVEHRERKEESN